MSKWIMAGTAILLVPVVWLAGSCLDRRGEGKSTENLSIGALEQPPTLIEQPFPEYEIAPARSAARGDTIVAGDWVQSYDFLAPARKAQESLVRYLAGKDYHEYRNPSRPHLHSTDGKTAYVEVSVLWTTHHPMIPADTDPEYLIQELHIIETWMWIEGEWFWVENTRQSEFLRSR